MKRILIRILSACALLLPLMAAFPTQRAQAQVQPIFPAGLHQAFLQVVSQPSTHRDRNSTNAEAGHPIAIAPLNYLERKIIADDGGGNNYFGTSVALSGNTAIIGAWNASGGGYANQGAAYIFTRSSAGWSLQQKLTPPEGGPGFGYSVAIDGNTAVVGVFAASVGGNSAQGAAYVFVRSGSTWSQQAKLVASDGAANDYFGNSVALSDNTIVVGAPYVTVDDSAQQGAAYVFSRSRSTWNEKGKLIAPDGAAADRFGTSVALSGNTILIGAWNASVDDSNYLGAAYVFVRSRRSWGFEQKLAASDGTANAYFGQSVALSGNTALVGAWQAYADGSSRPGAAYIFVRSGRTWSQEQKLTPSNSATTEFGTSVALSGNTALVGAAGTAYVFTRSGTTWGQEEERVPSDDPGSYSFGLSVALSCRTELIGAPYATVEGNAAQGAAYSFEITH